MKAHLEMVDSNKIWKERQNVFDLQQLKIVQELHSPRKIYSSWLTCNVVEGRTHGHTDTQTHTNKQTDTQTH